MEIVIVLAPLRKHGPKRSYTEDRTLSGYAAIQQAIAQPIRVKGPVRQQISGGQAADQRIGLAQIMSLPGHQTEIDEITERIRQSQYLCRYAAA
ncbi:hypothetical protein ACK6D9_15670 [Hoeflea sp. Naph1]|uniref:hypothetical protein n=1 Tax=Hoeflea sp. Naph1 TaxID=3388653 RepID=UPI00398FCD65